MTNREAKLKCLKPGSVFVCGTDDVQWAEFELRNLGRSDIRILPRSVLSFPEPHCKGKSYSEFDYDDGMFYESPVTSGELAGMLTFRSSVRV